MFKKLTPPGLFLLAALAFLAAPSQPLAASDCGGDGVNLCSITETCRSFWIFRWSCSTSWEYWVGL